MPDIHVIEPISWEGGGPVSKGPGGRPQQVSLHQGELDRACGVYSLLMALLVWGVVDRKLIRWTCGVAAFVGPVQD